jgi:hypothetical protein
MEVTGLVSNKGSDVKVWAIEVESDPYQAVLTEVVGQAWRLINIERHYRWQSYWFARDVPGHRPEWFNATPELLALIGEAIKSNKWKFISPLGEKVEVRIPVKDIRRVERGT